MINDLLSSKEKLNNLIDYSIEGKSHFDKFNKRYILTREELFNYTKEILEYYNYLTKKESENTKS